MSHGGIAWAVFVALGGLIWLANGASAHPAFRGVVLLSALVWWAYVVRDKSGRSPRLSSALAFGVLLVYCLATYVLE